MDRQRKSDLYAEVIAQAYPEDYYAEMEDVVDPVTLPVGAIGPNPGGGREDIPYPIGFSNISTHFDRIEIQLMSS